MDPFFSLSVSTGVQLRRAGTVSVPLGGTRGAVIVEVLAVELVSASSVVRCVIGGRVSSCPVGT